MSDIFQVYLSWLYLTVQSLPARDTTLTATSPVYKELQDRVDLFEVHLEAGELLAK